MAFYISLGYFVKPLLGHFTSSAQSVQQFSVSLSVDDATNLAIS
jgi:hypothetical protein